MKPRILLTGKNGQVGSELARLVASVGEVTALGRNELDLAKPADIRRVIAESRPRLVINAAAYTAVDQAEKEEPRARAINADAPALLAEEARKLGAFVIHYSTDYVFDGAKREPYIETDPTNPLNAYGRTKLAGEEAIRASGVAHLILRTAWVYAASGKNFLLTILRMATTREELQVVNDQFGAPTSARAIAEATVRILECGEGMPTERLKSGTYHLTAAGETTWYEFAVAIVNALQNKSSPIAPRAPLSAAPASAAPEWFAAATAGRPLIAKRIVPIATQDYPLPARRPAYSVLSNARFAATFGFSLPDWRRQLSSVLGSSE